MSKQDVDPHRVKRHKERPDEETRILLDDGQPDVFIVVTQVFCPHGHNLVGVSDETFDGFPGITFWVEHDGIEGEVVVSPIHGDRSKRGATFPDGAKLSLKCPTCRAEIPALINCSCSGKGQLRKLYLTPRLSDSHVVAVCDIWGCTRSRVIDSYEMFSEFLAGNLTEDSSA